MKNRKVLVKVIYCIGLLFFASFLFLTNKNIVNAVTTCTNTSAECNNLGGKCLSNTGGSNCNCICDYKSDCERVISEDLRDYLNTAFTIIRIAVPILLVVLIMKDFLSAVSSQKEEEMKKAQTTAIKRIIIGVIIFFIPTLVNIILGWIDVIPGTCGIG